MRKGDARRGELLATAERLFYINGYEKTSVQDILTEMNFSKGGFYHHFDSKLAVLEAICEMRATECCEQAREAMAACEGSAVDKLNAVFRASEVLVSGQQSFVSLLLQVAYREDGALMREKMKHSQIARMQPLLESIIAEGIAQKAFCLSDAQGSAQMLLRMFLLFSDEVALQLNQDESEERTIEALVRLLNLYRTAIERMLLAPFGSIELMEAKELQLLAQRVLRERVKRERVKRRAEAAMIKA